MNLLLVILALASPPSDSPRPDDPKRRKISVASAESLAVTISGSESGPPLVLIPGLFGAHFGFRKVIPPLNAAGYRTIVIEPLGVGSSSRPPHADYSLTAQADRIGRVLDSLDVDNAVIVAHALGAAMGLRLAYRRPDLVRGLVALDGGPSEAAVTPTFKRLLRLVPWIKLLGGVGLVRKKTRETMVHSSGDTTWVTDEVVAEYTAGVARDLNGTLKAYLAMAAAQEPGLRRDAARRRRGAARREREAGRRAAAPGEPTLVRARLDPRCGTLSAGRAARCGRGGRRAAGGESVIPPSFLLYIT